MAPLIVKEVTRKHGYITVDLEGGDSFVYVYNGFGRMTVFPCATCNRFIHEYDEEEHTGVEWNRGLAEAVAVYGRWLLVKSSLAKTADSS